MVSRSCPVSREMTRMNHFNDVIPRDHRSIFFLRNVLKLRHNAFRQMFAKKSFSSLICCLAKTETGLES